MNQMINKYREWIEKYIASHKFIVGLCASATQNMCKEFPELKRVPGHVIFADGTIHEHWWCEEESGNIIDPTAKQWQLMPVEYVAWKPGDEVCIGRCMNCGDYIYGTPESLNGSRKEICSDECYDDYANSLNDLL